MYWWNVSKLAEDFQEDLVDEKERFKYYLATVIVWTAFFKEAPYHGGSFNLVYLISYAIGIIGAIVGLTLCYRANKNGDNKDFIGRMICLSWPIGIKLSVILVLVFTLIIFNVIVAGVRSDSFGAVASVIALIIYLICYYRMLYKYVNIVAQSYVIKDLES